MLTIICGFKKEEAKGKIVPAHAMEAYGGGSRVILHLFINSALDGGDRVMEDRKKTIMKSTAKSGIHNNANFSGGRSCSMHRREMYTKF